MKKNMCKKLKDGITLQDIFSPIRSTENDYIEYINKPFFVTRSSFAVGVFMAALFDCFCMAPASRVTEIYLSTMLFSQVPSIFAMSLVNYKLPQYLQKLLN